MKTGINNVEFRAIENVLNAKPDARIGVNCPNPTWVFWVHMIMFMRAKEEMLTYWPNLGFLDGFTIHNEFTKTVREAATRLKRLVVMVHEPPNHSRVAKILEECGVAVFQTTQQIVATNGPIAFSIMDRRSFFSQSMIAKWNHDNPCVIFNDDKFVHTLKTAFEEVMESTQLVKVA